MFYKLIFQEVSGMKTQDEFKTFSIKFPTETWRFLKVLSARQNRSMTEIINNCLDKFKKKMEEKMNKDEEVL
jgi:predicted DNA-binding protein